MTGASRRGNTAAAAALLLAVSPPLHAYSFSLDYGSGLEGTLDTVLTAGAALRTQQRSDELVGKANVDPAVCGGRNQSCKGLFLDQVYPAEALVRAPGLASANNDDGNLNYDRGELTQAVFKATQRLSLSYGGVDLFLKWLYFHDFVNDDFTEYHPNRVTPENRERTGTTGQPLTANAFYDRVWGPGAPVRSRRSDAEVRRQIGDDLQGLDAYVVGTLPLNDSAALTIKFGRQTVNWGESTVLAINAVAQTNPVNVNNIFRVGADLSEFYTPTGMLFLSAGPFADLTVEAYYGFEWQPLEVPAPGSFLSTTDIGSNNAGRWISAAFGGAPEDPEGVAFPVDNPLSAVTNTSTTVRRLADREPRDGGQYGLALKYFAERLNGGTALGFYYLNYHSQLPYLGLISSAPGCARREGNREGIDATDGPSLLRACPDFPFLHRDDPGAATSDAVPFDSVQFFFEYPEDIQLYGLSFNTVVGELSLQGEVAWRPDMPLQVDAEDLAFHALGPTATRCHDPRSGAAGSGCRGTNGGRGRDGEFYGSSDFRNPNVSEYPDTFDLGFGHAPGSARAFPSFIGAYRGVAPGETPPQTYVQPWERFDVWQFNLGATWVRGASDNPLGADQVVGLFELGAQYVPGLPSLERLQIESPGTFYHASAGADGSGADGSRRACAHTVDCHVGADGLRFNPHQQDAEAYADRFSWGYALIAILRFENLVPGVLLQPVVVFQHDVDGTSTDAAAQFTAGRKDLYLDLELRYQETLSLHLGHTWFTGGGAYNLQKDRDQLSVYLKYQF